MKKRLTRGRGRIGSACVEAVGIVAGERTFGRAGRARLGEASDGASDSREVASGLASENVMGGILPGPEDNASEGTMGKWDGSRRRRGRDVGDEQSQVWFARKSPIRELFVWLVAESGA